MVKKNENYIKNIVLYYRNKLDQILKAKNIGQSSSEHIIFDFHINPNKTFNRSYAKYFIDEQPYQIAPNDTPKMQG